MKLTTPKIAAFGAAEAGSPVIDVAASALVWPLTVALPELFEGTGSVVDSAMVSVPVTEVPLAGIVKFTGICRTCPFGILVGSPVKVMTPVVVL